MEQLEKNPEIFYRKNEPDFKYLLKTQADMLDKTSGMLNDNGIILYMVCSFLKNETTDQVENFFIKK